MFVYVLLLSVYVRRIQVSQYHAKTWIKTSCKTEQMIVRLTVASAAEQF